MINSRLGRLSRTALPVPLDPHLEILASKYNYTVAYKSTDVSIIVRA